MNGLTLVVFIIICASAIYGAIRRFGGESRAAIRQILSIFFGIVSLWLSWLGSQYVNQRMISGPLHLWPAWLRPYVILSQHAPNRTRVLLFVVAYFIVGGILNTIFSLFQRTHVRFFRFPKWLVDNRPLGATLGLVLGGIRSAVLLGVIFIVLQYASIPALAMLAKNSSLYQWSSLTLYRPILQPLLSRELPVLAKSAFAPLTQSIQLFAIPTGVSGQERGIVIVPSKVAELSKQLTSNQHSQMDKAKALYNWEIHHVSYDWKKYDDYVYHGKWDEQSPLQTLTTGKGVCADYALLYADLAHSAGLTVRIDEGMGGTGGQFGSHAWNEVWDTVLHRWLYVDTTWGSQQDAWFDVFPTTFVQTHHVQNTIVIPAGEN
jgi:transglutaminase-like putative cysteine protease